MEVKTVRRGDLFRVGPRSILVLNVDEVKHSPRKKNTWVSTVDETGDLGDYLIEYFWMMVTRIQSQYIGNFPNKADDFDNRLIETNQRIRDLRAKEQQYA